MAKANSEHLTLFAPLIGRARSCSSKRNVHSSLSPAMEVYPFHGIYSFGKGVNEFNPLDKLFVHTHLLKKRLAYLQRLIFHYLI